MFLVVASDKLPSAIFIGTGPNLDTTCISKISRSTFLEFSKFWFLIPFLPKKVFNRPKMVKIQDVFSDMPCDLSNQTTLPALSFLNLFSSKYLYLVHISSIGRLTCRFVSMSPTIKWFAQSMRKSIFAVLLNYHYCSVFLELAYFKFIYGVKQAKFCH